jgi:hypothetical protein
MWANASLHSSKQVVVQRNGWDGKSARCTSGKALIPWQHHNNWEHNEILTLIACKHVKHIAWEKLINPRSQMIPIGCYAMLGKIPKKLQKKKLESKLQEGKQCVKTSGMHSMY